MPLKILYSEENSRKSFESVLYRSKANVKPKFTQIGDWDEINATDGTIGNSDLLVFYCSRKGSISYSSSFEKIPSKLEKEYPDNSVLIIYPQVNKTGILDEVYEDMTPDNLVKSIETIEQIGKGIGRIFRKREKTE